MDPDDEAVAYNEFLALARDEGLIALEIQIVQTPSEANGRSAVALATARSAQAVFSAVGEASPRSAPETWHPFLTTLAELRAKARALRDLTGLDHMVQEELTVPYTPTGDFADAPTRPAAPASRGTSAAPRSGPPIVMGAAGIAARPPATASRSVTPAAPSRPSAPSLDESEEDTDDDDEEPAAPRPIATARPTPAPSRSAPPDESDATEAADEPDEEALPPDHEGIAPDMLAKLKKLAISIADLEGAEITDAEATKRLDDFFMRAFKHPLSRASRLEGQRVVQYLSNDLVKRRGAAGEEKD